MEGTGFKNLMNFTEPNYPVPSRTQVTSMCCKRYESLKQKLKEDVMQVSCASITTDIWTSCTTQGYITVTAHYFVEGWKLVTKVLSTREIPERHTGVHISQHITEIVEEFGLDLNRNSAIVHDNASNMTVAVGLIGNVQDVSCFGDTLQLAFAAGLKMNSISQARATAKNLVGHFRHSVVSSQGLIEKQESMNIAEHRRMQDVITRWNSTS